MYKNYKMVSHSAQETISIGRLLARGLKGGDVICLSGDLGSGKTVFVQGLAYGLGVTEPVVSPTFSIVNEYEGKMGFYHFDMYRINSCKDILQDIGIEEYLQQGGVLAIEWFECIDDIIPKDSSVFINITRCEPLDENARIINIIAPKSFRFDFLDKLIKS